MRFWIFFSLGNAVLALVLVFLARLGHGKTTIPKGYKHFLQVYIAAVLGLAITRLAGVEVIKLVGARIDGGVGAGTFLGLTLVIPVALVIVALWTLVSKTASRQRTQQGYQKRSELNGVNW